MKKGCRRWLVIPPGSAYGAEGKPPKVPGDSTLLFDLQLVRVYLLFCNMIGRIRFYSSNLNMFSNKFCQAFKLLLKLLHVYCERGWYYNKPLFKI